MDSAGAPQAVYPEAGLDGHVFLVTAGAAGIGRACAQQIALGGGRVGIVDTELDAAERAADELRALGAPAVACAADPRDRAAITAAVECIERELGPLRGVVAAADLSIPEPAEAITPAAWGDVLGICLTGCFIVLQVVGRRLIAGNDGGSMVAVSSLDSFSAQSGRAAHCAAKFGVAGLVATLALEWGRHGIRVNAVAPGIVDAPSVRGAMPPHYLEQVLMDRTPMQRLVDADEVGRVAAFLLSQRADGVTGQNLAIDAGLSTGFITRWGGADYASIRLRERGVYGKPRAR